MTEEEFRERRLSARRESIEEYLELVKFVGLPLNCTGAKIDFFFEYDDGCEANASIHVEVKH